MITVLVQLCYIKLFQHGAVICICPEPIRVHQFKVASLLRSPIFYAHRLECDDNAKNCLRLTFRNYLRS